MLATARPSCIVLFGRMRCRLLPFDLVSFIRIFLHVFRRIVRIVRIVNYKST